LVEGFVYILVWEKASLGAARFPRETKLSQYLESGLFLQLFKKEGQGEISLPMYI
jgi:hypothetical protein